MSIKTIILILLSLYGVGVTTTMIIYIIKYSKKNNDYKDLNENYYNLLNKKKCPLNNDCITNLVNSTVNSSTGSGSDDSDNNYLKLIQSYDIYNNLDFYNSYDILDEYNDKIIIYSKNLKNCYMSCEVLNSCYGFVKYNNYCYLKNKFNLTDANNSTKTILVVKKNKINNTLNGSKNEDIVTIPNIDI